jgi:hypothetical protein
MSPIRIEIIYGNHSLYDVLTRIALIRCILFLVIARDQNFTNIALAMLKQHIKTFEDIKGVT